MVLYLLLTEAGTRWYTPISSTQVTRSGETILVKEHHYGAQKSLISTLIHDKEADLCIKLMVLYDCYPLHSSLILVSKYHG